MWIINILSFDCTIGFVNDANTYGFDSWLTNSIHHIYQTQNNSIHIIFKWFSCKICDGDGYIRDGDDWLIDWLIPWFPVCEKYHNVQKS